MSNSVQPHRRPPTRLPRPWDSPGKNTGVGCHFLLQCMKVKSESEVAQSHPTLSDPMDCSLLGSSVHGIFQARILEWGVIAFSLGGMNWPQSCEWTQGRLKPQVFSETQWQQESYYYYWDIIDIHWVSGVQHSDSQFLKFILHIVIKRYWLYSPRCTIYPCGLFILYIVAYIS